MAIPADRVDAPYSPQVYARAAGCLYLVVIAGGIFAEVFVRQRVVVAGDAAATAGNILAHEQLFRWGFTAELIPLLCLLPMALMLYELLKVVNSRVALLVVFFSLVGSAIEGVAMLGHFAPLIFLMQPPAPGIDAGVLQQSAYVALELQSVGFAVALTFFGGTLACRGYLVVRSGFLPSALGVLLVFGGAAYTANSFILFLAPRLAGYAVALLVVPGVAELALALWLIVKGIDAATWRARQAAFAAATP